MKNLNLKLGLIAGSLILVLGCSPPDETVDTPGETTGEEMRREFAEAVETTQKFVAEKRDEYEARFSQEIQDLKGEIEEMKIEATRASDEGIEELNVQWEKLADRVKSLEPELDRLREAGQDAWSSMAQGIQDSIDEIRQDYRQMKEDREEEDSAS